MRNRVDDAGETQPEGRNRQDGWAIYKNRKTGGRNVATRRNDDRPCKYKKETNRGTQGSNKNQKTKRSNGNRLETRLGERSKEDAAGRDKAPKLHDRRLPKKTEPKRRDGQIANICRTKKAPAQRKRATIQHVDPRTQRATEATQRATGYNPPAGRNWRPPEKTGLSPKKTPEGARRATEKT